MISENFQIKILNFFFFQQFELNQNGQISRYLRIFLCHTSENNGDQEGDGEYYINILGKVMWASWDNNKCFINDSTGV